MNAEQARLDEARERKLPWKKWGPYLSERQWGTVREDYSASGDAWNYFSHDHARSRAYRWGEDGIAGISDDQQLLCFGLTLWNGHDPILKERLFGLTNSEGNHGEDVKEYYFYLDSTPTHSYMKYLYKYPQAAYPYSDLVRSNSMRGRTEPEYELLDTGVFDQDRYFDVFVEYAKADVDDILIQITVENRGPNAAPIHLLPTLWFRNTWSWTPDGVRPRLSMAAADLIAASHPALGDRFLQAEAADALLFTENETNSERLFSTPNRTPYVKDAFHDHLIHRRQSAVNPEQVGTRAAAYYRRDVPAGGSVVVRLRLSDTAPSGWGQTGQKGGTSSGGTFDTILARRRKEADEFYASVIPSSLTDDEANVMRQALAGMLWSKQFFYYDVNQWLLERGSGPFKARQHGVRNAHWHHMHNADVISMPDKWEYPWYAAWDLAFHTLALTVVDPEFGKEQLDLMLQSRYLHPNGQLPAYEWNFGDVNPPVHAWATMFTYRIEKARGQADLDWLERSFQKLLLNFTWWVNRKDRSGSNVFEGGFLGLDNIGVFDRSAPLPTGGYLEQADGTAWMALFSQNLLEMCVELSQTKPAYRNLVQKFVEHVLWITSSMLNAGDGTGMWDDEDGFFYDVLRLPNGEAHRLKIRSMVGLLPFCAVTVFDGEVARAAPELVDRMREFLLARPELAAFIHDPSKVSAGGHRMSSALDEEKLRRVLSRMLDEREFLSPYGIRAMSRFHVDHPYVFHVGHQAHVVRYLPGESDSGMFGGNSNWRGPIWLPVNALIIRALLHYHLFYGDDFTIECPTGSGRRMNLYQVAEEIGHRLGSIFLRDKDGRRPVNGSIATFQNDPHWRDNILFYEFFHGDTGEGLGASHQTGWTGIIARIMHLFATTTSEQVLEMGKAAAFHEVESLVETSGAGAR
jgi:hypothetical protein